jgi:hypothetical protein
MAFLVAEKKKPAMDLRVEGLHAAVEHLGKSGVILHRHRGDFGLFKGFQGPAGGEDLRAVLAQGFGKKDKAGFIGDADECAANGVA